MKNKDIIDCVKKTSCFDNVAYYFDKFWKLFSNDPYYFESYCKITSPFQKVFNFLGEFYKYFDLRITCYFAYLLLQIVKNYVKICKLVQFWIVVKRCVSHVIFILKIKLSSGVKNLRNGVTYYFDLTIIFHTFDIVNQNYTGKKIFYYFDKIQMSVFHIISISKIIEYSKSKLNVYVKEIFSLLHIILISQFYIIIRKNILVNSNFIHKIKVYKLKIAYYFEKIKKIVKLKYMLKIIIFTNKFIVTYYFELFNQIYIYSDNYVPYYFQCHMINVVPYLT
jgi:hypothetical protein